MSLSLLRILGNGHVALSRSWQGNEASRIQYVLIIVNEVLVVAGSLFLLVRDIRGDKLPTLH